MNEQQRPRSSILFQLFSLRGDHELQSGLIKNVRLFVFAAGVDESVRTLAGVCPRPAARPVPLLDGR